MPELVYHGYESDDKPEQPQNSGFNFEARDRDFINRTPASRNEHPGYVTTLQRAGGERNRDEKHVVGSSW